MFSIHSKQGWIVTTRHRVLKKRQRKRWKIQRKADYKEPSENRYLWTLNLKLFRSYLLKASVIKYPHFKLKKDISSQIYVGKTSLIWRKGKVNPIVL